MTLGNFATRVRLPPDFCEKINDDAGSSGQCEALGPSRSSAAFACWARVTLERICTRTLRLPGRPQCHGARRIITVLGLEPALDSSPQAPGLLTVSHPPGREARPPTASVSRHEVSTVLSSSLSRLSFGCDGRPQCHGTRCSS